MTNYGTLIQIAIDNWYKSYLKPKIEDFKIWGVFLTDNIHWLFLTGEFVDSISKAVYKNLIQTSWKSDEKINQDNFQNQNDFIYLQNKEMWNAFNTIYDKVDDEKNLYKVRNQLVRELAYAISDTKPNNDAIWKLIENIYYLTLNDKN